MNIILLTGRVQRPIHLAHPKALILCLVALAVFSAVSVYAGYRLGLLTWEHELERQQQTLTEMSQSTRQGLSALNSRVGQLQARITRLDALGERLTELADLEEGEFDFQNPPAQGGPEVATAVQDIDIKELLSSMDKLAQRIEDREQQLGVLESMLMTHNLEQEVYPTGKPIKSGWMSSYFGMRPDPFTGRVSRHEGVDFAGKKGSDVVAVASGVVVFSGRRHGYGNLVEINHGNGYVTRYGHNQNNLVEVGDKVKKNQRIALMGSSGRSTGPHVHFEVLYKGKVVNPAKHIRASID